MRLPDLLVVAMLLGPGATAALPVEDVTDMTDFADVADDAMAKPPPHKVEKPWMMWGVRKPPKTSEAIMRTNDDVDVRCSIEPMHHPRTPR